jgi:hypothetical protein
VDVAVETDDVAARGSGDDSTAFLNDSAPVM